MRDLRVGNASGFYGDRFTAWSEMLTGGPLDVLTGDYLAELTMLILGRDRLADASKGYAKTFLRQMEDCLGLAMQNGVKIVTNAGGLNSAGLAKAMATLSQRLGISVQIGHVAGDEVSIPDTLTANAYLGAFGIAECLRAGADVVVTGRVTDASLVVGPAIAHFGWTRDDLDALAGATVAGHILECGTQATGGNFSFFTGLPDGGRRPAFPIAELHADGSAVITKHPGTGGAVTVETVTAQLLYEIGEPAYLGPDVVSHFDTIRLANARTDAGTQNDRVIVTGVRGTPPPETVKVGVNVLGGHRNQMSFVLCGLDIEAKAALVREQLETVIGTRGLTWRLARTEHPDADTIEAASALLTAHIHDTDAVRAGRRFSQAAVELALASYPGCTLTTAPGNASPYGIFRSVYLPQSAAPHTAVLPDGSHVPIPPPDVMTATPAKAMEPVAGEGTKEDASEDASEGTVDNTAEDAMTAEGETRRVPLGTLFGARSGDKGGDANLGVWARDDASYAWLAGWLTAGQLQRLLPECAELDVRRYKLANLRALNFVIHGLLGEGVAASTRFDPQAKALGEWLRSRTADIPIGLLRGTGHGQG